MIIAIYGGPGVGKTTVAEILRPKLGISAVLSTGSIAHAADPSTVGSGALAEESSFRELFAARLAEQTPPFIVDGAPRREGQVELFPARTVFVLLTCRPREARRRLVARGRPDDLDGHIEQRIAEQAAELDLDNPDGWCWRVAGSAFDTTHAKPYDVAQFVARELGL